MVLGECCHLRERFAKVEADEPANEQVFVELLDKYPIRTEAVDRLQQRRLQQVLWQN